VTIAATLVLFAAGAFLGDLNSDEGWYLYAGRLVAGGQLPYVDFAFTQGPVMPFVYALASPVVARFGVAGGRLFTAGLGLMSILSSAWLCWRIAPRPQRRSAALLATAILGINVYQCYFCSIAKTYALAGFLLTSGFLALSYAGGRKGNAAAALAGVLMALATATRSSAGFAVPVVVVGLWWFTCRPRREGHGPDSLSPGVLYSFFFGGLVSGCILFIPFFMMAPKATWFAMVEYHAGRSVGGALTTIAYKAGFVSRLASAYTAGIALLLCCAIFRTNAPRPSNGEQSSAETPERPDPHGHCPRIVSILAWWSVAAITLVHVMAPFPYDDYQVFVYPVFAAVLGARLMRLVAARVAVRADGQVFGQRLLVSVVAVCLVCALASPVIWQWFLGERDRMWWPLKEQTPLSRLQEAGQLLRQNAPAGGELLTQDTYLAVEAGMTVPRGLELGPFSYFPDWTRERAESRGVLNRGMLLELLRTTEAPLAAFSGYGLSIRCPEIALIPDDEQEELWEVVKERYETLETIKRFGQAETTLNVMKKKGE
jgi:hypothetical protein